LPAHYLKWFHPAYLSKAEIDQQVRAAGFRTWTELFAAKAAPPENPERPTMAAWVPVTRVSDPVFTLRRNPYYALPSRKGRENEKTRIGSRSRNLMRVPIGANLRAGPIASSQDVVRAAYRSPGFGSTIPAAAVRSGSTAIG
jgi:hypothetical protein